MAIQRQPGTNTIEVVDSIKRQIPGFRSQLPGNVQLNILFDHTESIRDSVADVKFTLALTVALFIMVIFLFLRNLSATVIPSLALPLSIIGTFGAMYGLGFSVNNITLMALTLSVGFVVDDAIVMLENIGTPHGARRKTNGCGIRGFEETRHTIISHDALTRGGFYSVLFMGGMLGRNSARVCRDHHVFDTNFRSCFPYPYADALQPFSQTACRKASWTLYDIMERIF